MIIFILSHSNYIPSSQPPQYVPPSSKSKRPPFICGLVDVEFAAAVAGVTAVDADPGEFGAIAVIFETLKQVKNDYLRCTTFPLRTK